MSRIGIDFGTSFSVVSYICEDGTVKAVPDPRDAHKRTLTPSVVALTETGKWTVGYDAVSRRSADPNSTLSSIKRLLGKQLSQIRPQTMCFPCELTEDEARQLRVLVQGQSLLPTDIAKIIFQSLKHKAESFLEQPIEQTVVAVPSYFDESQQEAIKSAALSSGLNSLRFVEEPLAAALAYAGYPKDPKPVAVFDLGGGSFNISIIDLQDKMPRLLANAGSSDLGGEDINMRLAKDIFIELENNHGIQLGKDLIFRQKVLDEIERAKRAVSHRGSCDLHVLDQGKQIDYSHALSRFEMTTASQEVVRHVDALCGQAMKQAGLQADGIKELVLVGGCSRMQVIQKAAEKNFQRPAYCHLNPDEAVALGAALFGNLN